MALMTDVSYIIDTAAVTGDSAKSIFELCDVPVKSFSQHSRSLFHNTTSAVAAE
jgi:hypothetical protein